MQLWQSGELAKETRRSHGIETTTTYKGNPVEQVVNSGKWLDCRLQTDEVNCFPVLQDLHKEGYTHYVMGPLRFSDGTIGAALRQRRWMGGSYRSTFGCFRTASTFLSRL